MAPSQVHRVGASGTVRDLVWLNQQLSKALGWDAFVIEDVVENIAGLPNRASANDLVENVMGNDAAVIRVVNEFFASRIAPPGQHPHTTNNNTSGGGRSSNDQCQPQNGSNNSSNINGSTSTGSAMKLGQNAYSAAVGGANSNSNGVGGKTAVPADGWRALSRNDDAEQDYKSSGSSKGKGGRAAGSAKPEALVEQPPPPTPRVSEKVLGMFKQGGKIKTSAASSKPKDAGPVLPDKPIVNCLGCGKIYDCRTAASSSDVRQFLESGGICTYCEKAVSLTYKDRIAQQQQQQQDQQTQQEQSQEAAPPAGDAATVKAIAFKDRLVEYDRNAAKRTAVIDDQSDYFEIDSNAWLNDAEREVLRRQRVIEQEAEEIRKKRVTITLDLIGRKVVMDAAVHTAASGRRWREVERAEAAVVLGSWGAKGQLVGALLALTGPAAAERRAIRWHGGVRGEEVACQAHGGGASSNTLTAPPAATAADLARAVNQLREMKISINPNLTAASKPVFLASVHSATHPKPPTNSNPQQQQQQGNTSNPSSSQSIPGQTYNNLNSTPQQQQQKQHPNSNGGGSSSAANGSSNSRTGPGGPAPGTSNPRSGPGVAGSRKVADGSRKVGQGGAGRLQHDHGSEFNALIEDDLGIGAGEIAGGRGLVGNSTGEKLKIVMPEGGGLLIEQIELSRPFDLCPPDMAADKGSAFASIVTLQRGKGAAPARPPPAQATAPSSPTPTLPPGMVLLKSWLSITEQAKLIKEIKKLGVGSGGFYTPSYPDGAQLALRMMCMGKHWEPTTASYTDARSHK
ncbi:MAG: hypothetical protein WDW38_010359 [Sanguina aurantia]